MARVKEETSSWRALLSCWGMLDDPEIRKPVIRPVDPGPRMSPIKEVLKNLNDPNSRTISADLSVLLAGTHLHAFNLNDLRSITQNFSSMNFLGEGGFGPVHKGFIDDRILPGFRDRPVAVKILDLDGKQGHQEWLVEILVLGQLSHPHLVKLIGYCCEDVHRVLIYEYMVKGSLENHLFGRFSTSLPWLTRLKIALGAAKGLAFLHEGQTPIIFRDMKASNILLDSDYTSKLSDFGLAKDGPWGGDEHTTVSQLLGTEGYAAPEYLMTGRLSIASDVYSFGVVLLELLTGRRAMDKTRPQREQRLAEWARPQLQSPRRLSRLIDPRLQGQYSETGAQKMALLAYQCLSDRTKSRPTMNEVVDTINTLLDLVDDIPSGPFVYSAPGTNGSPNVCVDKDGKREHESYKQERPIRRTDINRLRAPKPSGFVSPDPNEQRNLRNVSNSPSHHRMGRAA